MKLSSRERFLIGVLFTIIIWAVALEVFIWPGRAEYRKSVELMESGNQEREEMEFYLSHYEELEQKLKEWESLRNDIFMDRSLQDMAARAGVSIRRMSIGGAAAAEISYDTQTYDAQSDDPEESGKPAVESGPAGRTVKESVITMEIECPDPKGVMTFADEIYREQKSVLVSFMDVEAVYESGEDGQETYQGMKASCPGSRDWNSLIITSAPWPAKGRESLPEKPLQWSLAWKKRTESGKYLNSMKSLNRRRIQATI